MKYDVTIVGAGIVGLSTAYKLSLAKPGWNILVLEKEEVVAAHQTGRNSGVIHSGIYYKPGSYRARNCVDGRLQLIDFCGKYGIACDICGKVIVAVTDEELPRLQAIYERGKQNGLSDITLIGQEQLHEIEPHVAGLRAIHVPYTGIVDFIGVCRKLKELLEERSGEILFRRKVRSIKNEPNGLRIETENETYSSRFLINCAGLHSDRVARLAGYTPSTEIVPFRGEYYKLKSGAEHLVKTLIYPVPNPEFPFLGVHFTSMALGGVECGPNAVFAFKREGYSKFSFDAHDTLETLRFPGFWKLIGRHWRMGLGEWHRSLSKQAFLKGLQNLIPELRSEDIEPAPAGVRAMALTPKGEIVDDFSFVADGREIHVLNAPSPAATAGLSIGDEIVRRALAQFPV